MRAHHASCCALAALVLAGSANADSSEPSRSGRIALEQLTIAAPSDPEKRPITVDDVVKLRHIDALSISADGRRFAMFVREGDPQQNSYHGGWFVGSTESGALTYVGHGGQVDPDVLPGGEVIGEFHDRASQWSPDGNWIAYRLKRDGEVQLWRSRIDGSVQEQVTRHDADVREFAWNQRGDGLFFTAGRSRSELLAEDVSKARNGFRYDSDLNVFTDAMRSSPPRASETDFSLWLVELANRRERRGGAPERKEYERMRLEQTRGSAPLASFYQDAAVPPVARADGAVTWLARVAPASRRLRVMFSRDPSNAKHRSCSAPECVGVIPLVWWSNDGKRIYFWRQEGINNATHAVYGWNPSSGSVVSIFRAQDDRLELCSPAALDRMVCVRETKTQPVHLAAIDCQTGAVQVLADVNPEFRNIQLGEVERFEWDTPQFSWNKSGGHLAGLFPNRAYGYVLYPPDFDATKSYPVFIAPYVAFGFNSAEIEHALHVYAANGFVVVNTAFPIANDEAMERLGSSAAKEFLSPELGYPDMSMLMESTLRGLDTIAARSFIDESRVGIGGISTATFVPLYMLQKHDRIAAISISSPHWGPLQYYWGTRRVREAIAASYGKVGLEDYLVKPEGKGAEFWSAIDIADHVDTIEAPILMNLADWETFALLRLLRHLEDADLPYDAYVFPNEAHQKWQPSHMQSIMKRNLDWFRFWLQDAENPDPQRRNQYALWRQLRELQCRNPRSLRNYCNVVGVKTLEGSPVH